MFYTEKSGILSDRYRWIKEESVGIVYSKDCDIAS